MENKSSYIINIYSYFKHKLTLILFNFSENKTSYILHLKWMYLEYLDMYTGKQDTNIGENTIFIYNA